MGGKNLISQSRLVLAESYGQDGGNILTDNSSGAILTEHILSEGLKEYII